MCRKASSKKSKVTSCNWPMFLMISSSDEGALKKLSPFLLFKNKLIGLTGGPKRVTKLKNGSLLSSVPNVNFTRQCVHQHVATSLP